MKCIVVFSSCLAPSPSPGLWSYPEGIRMSSQVDNCLGMIHSSTGSNVMSFLQRADVQHMEGDVTSWDLRRWCMGVDDIDQKWDRSSWSELQRLLWSANPVVPPSPTAKLHSDSKLQIYHRPKACIFSHGFHKCCERYFP